MALIIKKASRQSKKIKMALIGVAGSGKTYSALKIAKGLGDKVLLLDSEHGSASAYADLDFDTAELESFSPQTYVEAIHEVEQAGYDVLIIDSLSHAWTGKDGALEQVDRAGRRSQSGNSFAAWRDVTPLHNAMIDAIVGAKIHIIATLRAKTEYIVEAGKNGKSAPRKVGMAPVQRDGLEYEFDVVGEIDNEHYLSIGKTRCRALDGQVIHCPGEDVAAILRDWLGSAVTEPAVTAPTYEIIGGDGGIDKDGIAWCHCGIKARKVTGKSGSGFVCGEKPARCDFKIKETQPDPTPEPQPKTPEAADEVAAETEAGEEPHPLEAHATHFADVPDISDNLTKAVRAKREASTTTKEKQRPLVKLLCTIITNRGLSFDPVVRTQRIEAYNQFLMAHDMAAVQSTNDIPDEGLRLLAAAIEKGQVFWPAPEPIESQAEVMAAAA